ncbi:MAG: TlpA family protein disulfide reductase [Actinobacteria bacterium]|nr:TlpA family protein disulfide reductase [Actinomycetota bacterium]
MTAKRTQKPRRPSKAEIRAAARRRAQRRNLAYALAAAAVVVLVAVLVTTTGTGGDGGTPAPAGQVEVSAGSHAGMLTVGEAIPDFSAPGLDGGRVTWSDYEGSPTVLAVWAAWCPHCQVELPVLDEVSKEFPAVRLVSVVTAIGRQPGPSPREYMRENGLSFPVAVDDADGTLARALGIEGFPTAYYVGSDGTVQQATSGETDRATLRDLFASLS